MIKSLIVLHLPQKQAVKPVMIKRKWHFITYPEKQFALENRFLTVIKSACLIWLVALLNVLWISKWYSKSIYFGPVNTWTFLVINKSLIFNKTSNTDISKWWWMVCGLMMKQVAELKKAARWARLQTQGNTPCYDMWQWEDMEHDAITQSKSQDRQDSWGIWICLGMEHSKNGCANLHIFTTSGRVVWPLVGFKDLYNKPDLASTAPALLYYDWDTIILTVYYFVVCLSFLFIFLST